MRYKVLKTLSKILFVLIIICAVFVLLLNLNVVSLNDIVEPVAITLNQNEVGIKKGKTYQLEATVEPSNAKFGSYIWESSDPDIATVNETTGYITAKNYGDCIITVKTELGDVVSNCLVHVSNKDVVVTNLKFETDELSLSVGQSKSLSFKIAPPNGTTNYYVYKSSDNSVAIVNENGIVKAIAPGNCIITVENKINGVKDTLKLTVFKVDSAISIPTTSPLNPTIPVLTTQVKPTNIRLDKETVTIKPGSKISLIPEISPDNAVKSVNWSSSDTKIATVDKNGVVTGIKIGTCTIVCTTVNGLTSSTEIIVANSTSEKPRIEFASRTLDMKVGDLKTLSLNYYLVSSSADISWDTTNASIVTVNNGTLHAANPGSAVVTASAGGYTASITVYVGVQETVIPLRKITFKQDSFTCKIGDTINVETTLEPSNTTEWYLLWTSSNGNVASVAQGSIKCLTKGVASITATGGSVSKGVSVTVEEVEVQSIVIEGDTRVAVGASETVTAKILPLNATNNKVTWTSSDPSIFTVNNYGFIEGISKGTATLTATASNGKTASTTITVE